MKILHVVHGFPPAHHGGTERYVDRLVRGLDAAGHDVAVVTGSEVPSETAEIVRSNRGGVEVIEIRRSGLYLESWYRSHSPDVEALFRDVLGEEQPDLVHVHHWKRLTRTLVEVATRAGLPCVVTLHDVHSTCPKVLRFRDGSFCERPVSFASCGDCAERFFFQDDREVERLLESYRLDFAQELVAASAVIAPTQGLVHLIEEHHPAAKGRLRVLPHWRPDTQPPRRSVELASNKALHLVYWGALDPIKGPHLILEALKLVSAPQLFLVEIWGEAAAEGADYEARLQALASGLDVRFHGAFSPEDLPVGLGDIAVLPSLAFETYSFTLDEAFERGLPVIVHDRGALDERAGKAGVRFEAENAADLARVFEELAGDAERLGALRAAIPLPTTEKEHLDALVGIYEEALQTEVRVDQLDARRNRSRAVNLSLQLEARDRELYALRGLADSELDRAAGLDREVALREEGIRGRDAVLESFVGNLGELSAALRVRDEDIAKLTLTIQKERDEASRRVARRDETIKQQSASLEEFALSVGQFQQLVEELRTAQRTAEERIQDLDASLHESSRAHEQAAAGLADREKRLDELQRALQASDRRADRLEQMRRNLQSEA
ncbi:MAG: glycosyltransferase, partial [Planctomycetes bacterium]|nr:glycosyltransferase [Planctomycetota bacterium]